MKLNKGMQNIKNNGERISSLNLVSIYDRLEFNRHFAAYNETINYLNLNFNLLDVGCGEGYGVNILSGYSKSILGVDVNAEVIEHAKSHYKAENLEFKAIKRIDEIEAKYDVILIFQVIEHIPNDLEFLNQLFELLNPNGKILITTPVRNWRLFKNETPWNPFHIREYDLETIKVLFKNFNYTLNFINATNDSFNLEKKRLFLNRQAYYRQHKMFFKYLKLLIQNIKFYFYKPTPPKKSLLKYLVITQN